MAAYAMYAGKVPLSSMQILVYMALVSRDGDESPWFSQGRSALAENALGRVPGAASEKADHQAAERAMKPLFAIGAITTDRRASPRRDGSGTARYRLHLMTRRALTLVPAEHVVEPRRAVDNPERPSNSGLNAPRISVQEPLKSGPTPPEIQGPEEPGGTMEERGEEYMVAVGTSETVTRACGPQRHTHSPARCPDHPWAKIGAGHGECVHCRTERMSTRRAVS